MVDASIIDIVEFPQYFLFSAWVFVNPIGFTFTWFMGILINVDKVEFPKHFLLSAWSSGQSSNPW